MSETASPQVQVVATHQILNFPDHRRRRFDIRHTQKQKADYRHIAGGGGGEGEVGGMVRLDKVTQQGGGGRLPRRFGSKPPEAE